MSKYVCLKRDTRESLSVVMLLFLFFYDFIYDRIFFGNSVCFCNNRN